MSRVQEALPPLPPPDARRPPPAARRRPPLTHEHEGDEAGGQVADALPQVVPLLAQGVGYEELCGNESRPHGKCSRDEVGHALAGRRPLRVKIQLQPIGHVCRPAGERSGETRRAGWWGRGGAKHTIGWQLPEGMHPHCAACNHLLHALQGCPEQRGGHGAVQLPQQCQHPAGDGRGKRAALLA